MLLQMARPSPVTVKCRRCDCGTAANGKNTSADAILEEDRAPVSTVNSKKGPGTCDEKRNAASLGVTCSAW